MNLSLFGSINRAKTMDWSNFKRAPMMTRLKTEDGAAFKTFISIFACNVSMFWSTVFVNRSGWLYGWLFSLVFKCCDTIQILECGIDLQSSFGNLAFVYTKQSLKVQHYLPDFWALSKSQCFIIYQHLPISTLIKYNSEGKNILFKGFWYEYSKGTFFDKSRKKKRRKENEWE